MQLQTKFMCDQDFQDCYHELLNGRLVSKKRAEELGPSHGEYVKTVLGENNCSRLTEENVLKILPWLMEWQTLRADRLKNDFKFVFFGTYVSTGPDATCGA